jgi:hypothetical protein
MARLAAIEKGLFFATPDRVASLVAETVVFVGNPARTIPLLDPCAGEGRAAAILSHAWGTTSYGVELDEDRARKAASCMHVCLQGSYHRLAAEKGNFPILFLNPPYDTSEDEDGTRTRQEVQFLRHATRWLAPGGLLIFVPPRRIVDRSDFATIMSKSYKNAVTYDFPEPEKEAFDQVVVLAQKTDANSWGQAPQTANLYALGTNPYRIILPHQEAPKVFRLTAFDPEASRPTAADGVYGGAHWDLLVGDRGCQLERPLVRPRPGHLALLLAAGELNGTELSGGKLLKGASEKVTSETTEEQGDKTVTIVRERIVSRLAILDLKSGDWERWRVDEHPDRTAQWFAEHGGELARAVLASHQPQYTGEVAQYAEQLSHLTAPGVLPGHSTPQILDQQIEAAAATVQRWQQHKNVLLSGEMGTGKTTVAVVAVELARLPKVIVVCPGHLVPKWRREIETITGERGIATTAKTLSAVDAFFFGPARYLVLSKDGAKLGARWQPAATTRRVRTSVEVIDHEADRKNIGWDGRRWYGAPPPPKKIINQIERLVCCPRCGAAVEREGIRLGVRDGQTVESRLEAKDRTRCAACKEPLWQAVPITAKGTKRWSIAKYINQRYQRRFSLVIDEVHSFAGADSDQSQAIQHLATGARKILAMTGTVYGGRASSLFHLLYKIDPVFRQAYGFKDRPRFVEHHGLFETRYEEETRRSCYGRRRGHAGGRVREIPGMNPAMISILLSWSVFLRLKDLRQELPPYSEEVLLVDHDPAVLAAAKQLQGDVRSVLRKHPRVLGAYLMACLGYPDCPEQAEKIVDEDEDGATEVLATAPAFPEQSWPKDVALVDLVRSEKAAGRQVLVFLSQTHRRPAGPRIQRALEAAGLRVEVLGSNVAPEKREEWLASACERGFDALLTNGRLVETGMDLMFAATIVQYGTEYSIPSLRQQIRRSWRLGQRKPIRVIFMAYRGTMQETALSLISRKMLAAERIDGDEAGGLAQFDESGSDFFLELAHAAVERHLERPAVAVSPPVVKRVAVALPQRVESGRRMQQLSLGL